MSITPADARSLPRPSPHVVAVVAIAILVLGAWAALVVEAMRLGSGPDAFLQALCRPGARTDAATGAALLGGVALAALLWMAMSVAMMLPTAVPMVLGFVDLLDRRGGTAARSSAAPLLLVAGYLAVWAVVALGAALLQAGFGWIAALVALPDAAAAILAGAVVGAAGLYQFSTWKMAFLGACRHPLPDLDRGFAPDAAAVLRLGVGQGLRCLGCCGPMMAIMLVAGAMNLAWMGLFALMMTLEKMTEGPLVPRIVGVLLVAGGLALGISAVGIGPVVAFLLRG